MTGIPSVQYTRDGIFFYKHRRYSTGTVPVTYSFVGMLHLINTRLVSFPELLAAASESAAETTTTASPNDLNSNNTTPLVAIFKKSLNDVTGTVE